MSIQYSNEEGYGLSVAVWLADDEYDHAPVSGPYISVTALLKPVRQIVLDQRVRTAKAKSGASEVIDLSRFVPARLGTAIHSAIEHSWTRTLKDGRKAYIVALQRLGYPNGVISKIRVNPTEKELDTVKGIIPVFLEVRSFKKIGKWTIGGQFDFVGNGNLEDFKSMGVYGFMKGDKDEEQLMQGSLYRWLNPKIITSDTMKVQQIFTDWSKLDAKKKKNPAPGSKFKIGYPQYRILEKKLALQIMDKWVAGKIMEIDQRMLLPEKDLPRCTQKELWQDPPVYKYYGITKKNTLSKVATMTADNYARVHERFLKDGSTGTIKEVFAPVRRCGYCGGFDLCTQKDEYAAAGILQLP